MQRALSPIRTLPDRLPGEEFLSEVRDLLHTAVPGPAEEVDPDVLTQAELEVDRLLEEVAAEFLSILEAVSFSELRAALPRARDARPDDVGALLDLCLEPEDPSPRILSVIDYLATLLSTVFTETGGRLAIDPVSATPNLRRRCERFTDYDPEEVQSYVAAFDAAITELSRVEMIDEVMSQARELKTRLGRLRFAPELLRKIVDYNLSATNRLEDTIEAERLLHELDVETATRPRLEDSAGDPESTPTPAPELGLEGAEGETPEAREGDAIDALEQAVSRRLDGYPSSRDDVAQLADAIDLSILSAWERKAFASEDDGGTSSLVRRVVVVGSLLRTADSVPTLLTRVGLPVDRLRGVWAPDLDARVQGTIARSLRGNAHREAKQLSQTRAKFLYRLSEPAGPVDEAPEPARGPLPELPCPLELGRERKFAPFAPTDRLLRRPGSAQLRRRMIGVIGAFAVLIALGLHLSASKDPRSVRVMEPESIAELSPHLESGYRDGLGNGPTFIGTVRDSWRSLSVDAQREETSSVGTRLRWTGVREIMLFDGQRRLRARWVGGEVLHPKKPPKRTRRRG
jgi:hypothetical protein